MKKIFVLVAIAALFSGAAYANYCARDVVPSATLLVPYIAVGMTGGVPNPSGATTLFAITNVSRDAQIVHVSVFDAESNPEVDFDVILSGYDVWSINWRDFLNGRFDLFDTSRTAFGNTPSRDPFEWGPDGRDTVGITGILTTPEDRNITPSTNCVVPYGDLSTLSATIISKLDDVLFARVHEGCTDPIRPAYEDDWLSKIDASTLFFYAVADVVTTCNTAFPDNAAYWTGFGSNENVLVGDVIYLDSTNNYSEAMPAVHIEASVAAPLPNFYLPLSGEDNREPLATAFAFRYADAPTSGVTSSVIMWKNVEDFENFDLVAATPDTIDDCGYYLYYAWDENEHSLSRTPVGGPSGFVFDDVDPNEFPYETQEVALSTENFDLYSFGWMLVVFTPSYDIVPVPDKDVQAWAAVRFKFGTYSAGMEAATMANAHCFPAQVLPTLGTNPGL
jgi:hypothetical protein